MYSRDIDDLAGFFDTFIDKSDFVFVPGISFRIHSNKIDGFGDAALVDIAVNPAHDFSVIFQIFDDDADVIITIFREGFGCPGSEENDFLRIYGVPDDGCDLIYCRIVVHTKSLHDINCFFCRFSLSQPRRSASLKIEVRLPHQQFDIPAGGFYRYGNSAAVYSALQLVIVGREVTQNRKLTADPTR